MQKDFIPVQQEVFNLKSDVWTFRAIWRCGLGREIFRPLGEMKYRALILKRDRKAL